MDSPGRTVPRAQSSSSCRANGQYQWNRTVHDYHAPARGRACHEHGHEP
jgi:hypothetical protein